MNGFFILGVDGQFIRGEKSLGGFWWISGIVAIHESEEQQDICLLESFFAWKFMEKDPDTVN